MLCHAQQHARRSYLEPLSLLDSLWCVAMIDSEHLRSFVAFAETANFTRAAERLHLSQPALFVQIKKLAQALDTPLYTRRGRTLELTVQGKKLLAYGREQSEREQLLLQELKPG